MKDKKIEQRALEQVVQVKQKESDGHARIVEIQVGEKQIQLPGYLPAIKSETDYNILFDDDYDNERVIGYLLPFFHINSRLIKSRREDANSMVLDSNGSFGPKDANLVMFEKTRMILVDPMCEYYYYNAKKDRFGRIGGLPHSMQMLAQSKLEDHESTWKKIVNDGYLLDLQKWMVNYQRSANADIVIPSVPFISKNTPELLDIAARANRTAETAVQMSGLSKNLCAHYYVFHSNFFENRELVEKLISYILDAYFNEKDVKFLFFKIMNEDIHGNHVQRDNFKQFLAALDSIRRESGMVVGMLNATTVGLASMGAGVDFFSESMDGEDRDKGFGGRGGRPSYRKGKWYNPATGTSWKYPEIKRYIDINGALPAEGRFGRKLSENEKNVEKISDFDWNTKHRRKHLIEERSIEVMHLLEAIRSQDTRWLKEKLLESDLPNLAKIL